MLNLVETIYIMHCGCQLKQEELLLLDGLFVCPVHSQRVLHLKKYCVRCGDHISLDSPAVPALRRARRG